MTKLRTIMSIGASALVMAIAATPAYAQDAPADAADDGTNPEIVVTAQFRQQRLQDTPLAITAVNAAMLEARGQTDIAAVAAQSPNVTLKPQPQNNGIGLIAFIRGVGQIDFNYALEPGVGIYVDDVYIPTLSSSMLDLMDLDRIEVLRGPQGTLAGKNSIGGAIKLFSQKPDGTGKGSFSVTYGSHNRIDARGMADFALGEKLFARISAVTKNRNGYVTLLDYGLTHPTSNVPGGFNNAGKSGVLGTLGGQNFAAGRIALRWLPSDSIELNVSADYTKENSDSGAEVLVRTKGLPVNAGVTPDTPGIPWLVGKDGNAIPVDCRFVPYGSAANSCDVTPAGYDPRFISYSNFLDARTPTAQAPFKPYAAIPGNKFEGWGVHGNLTADLSETLQAVWISSYRKYMSTWGMDQDSTPVPVAQLNQTLNHSAWSQELRLNGSVADKLFEYTLGGFYFDQSGTLQARVDLNYAGIDFIHGPDTTPSTSKALFFNGTLHPVEGMSINGGIRQSWDKKVYTYFRSNPDGTIPTGCVGPPPFTVITQPRNCLLNGVYNVQGLFEGKRTDWRLAVDYRFSPELMTYASVATGYKGGGVNPRPFFATGAPGGPCNTAVISPGAPLPCNQALPFRPETMTTYELGFKADLMDRKWRLNGAVFLNKYSDIILTLTACPDPRLPCLLPANVGTADVKGIELETTIRPTDGLTIDGSFSYIDFEYKSTAPNANIPAGAVSPFTPKYTYSFGIQYDAPAFGGTLTPRFDGNYQSHVFFDADNAPESRIDSRFLANASLRYTTADKDWQVALEVQNLFNKYYYVSRQNLRSLGVETAMPALLRTWAITVKRNF